MWHAHPARDFTGETPVPLSNVHSTVSCPPLEACRPRRKLSTWPNFSSTDLIFFASPTAMILQVTNVDVLLRDALHVGVGDRH
jgi:hypothetical protein